MSGRSGTFFDNYEFTSDPIVYLRTPLLPYDVACGLFCDRWQEALLEMLRSDRSLRLSILLASKALYSEVERWLATDAISERAARRVLSYVVRASTRTTPFGMFAALSRVRVGSVTDLQLESLFRTRTRLDNGWLSSLLKEKLRSRAFIANVRVNLNEAILRRGRRMTVYDASKTSRRQSTNGAHAYTTVSLKITEPVAYLCANLTQPKTVGEIAELLHRVYGERIEDCLELVDELRNAGFLVDEFRLDPTAVDQPALSALARIDTHLSTELADVRDAIRRLDETPVAARVAADYSSIAALQQRIHDGMPAELQTDSLRELNGMLDMRVLDDVGRLAGVMLRCAPLELRRYRERFIERYEGTTREVPLLELVHPSLGLGIPDDLTIADALQPDYLERRMMLASQALIQGQHELQIDDKELDELLPPISSKRLAPSFDVGFEILADSAESVACGNYLVTYANLFATHRAGSTLGRFADAVSSGRSDLRRTTDWLVERNPDQLVTELVVSPVQERALNVSTRPATAPYQIRIGFMSDPAIDNALPLEDLMVGLDHDGFYVRSIRLQKRLLVTEGHVFDTPGAAPSIARFLSLLSRDGVIAPRKFDWGPAARELPFLPRLRCGRIIVAKARWRFSKQAISDALSIDGLEHFLKTWSIPAHVQLAYRDHKLPLDLSTSIGRELLRDHLRSHEQSAAVTLEEVLPASSDVWLQDERGRRYRAEFVASAVATRTASPVLVCAPASRAERTFPLGSEWTYFKLFMETEEIDRLLATEIAPAVAAMQREGLLKDWFFVRYADPRPHLRVRLRSVDRPRDALHTMQRLVAELTSKRVIASASIHEYEREIERYGGTEGMLACERLFCADSDFVAQELFARAVIEESSRVEFAALSLALIARSVARTAPALFDPLLVSRVRRKLSAQGRTLERAIKERLIAGTFTLPSSLEDAVCAVARLGASGQLTRDLQTVIDDVLHMHCNRCGVDDEANVRAIARQVIQSLKASHVTPA